MRERISHGRLMMMGDEERAEYMASQMTIDSDGLVQVEDNFMNDVIPSGQKVDLLKHWNDITRALGMPLCADDLVEDRHTTIEVYQIRNRRTASDELIDLIGGMEIQIDFTSPRQSPIRAYGETEVRHYIPDPSIVSHAQREPAAWTKDFFWGKTREAISEPARQAKNYRDRKPVPKLNSPVYGNDCYLDDIRAAVAEGLDIDFNEVIIDIPEYVDEAFFYR